MSEVQTEELDRSKKYAGKGYQEVIKNLILSTYGGSNPNGLLATIFISATTNASQKGVNQKMITTNAEISKDLEKALQELEQAKQRVANAKKKQNEKRRKAENHHKYIMGGIIVKHFPDCYSFDEGELNRILSVALQTRECQQTIAQIRAESTVGHSAYGKAYQDENEREGDSYDGYQESENPR